MKVVENSKAVANTIGREVSEYRFWTETSGSLEVFFRNSGFAYAVPHTLSAGILGLPACDVRLSEEDDVHYRRKTDEGDWWMRMIFGLQSEDAYKAVLAAVDEYSKFLKEVERYRYVCDSGLKYSLRQAVYITDNIVREYTQNHFYEMVPSWQEALRESLRTFRVYNAKSLKFFYPEDFNLYNGESPKVDYLEEYIKYCEYLFKNMPLLQLHETNILVTTCQQY